MIWRDLIPVSTSLELTHRLFTPVTVHHDNLHLVDIQAGHHVTVLL
jgi:hypothetical protein